MQCVIPVIKGSRFEAEERERERERGGESEITEQTHKPAR